MDMDSECLIPEAVHSGVSAYIHTGVVWSALHKPRSASIHVTFSLE